MFIKLTDAAVRARTETARKQRKGPGCAWAFAGSSQCPEA